MIFVGFVSGPCIFTHSRAHVQFRSNFVKISRVILLKQLKADIECDHLTTQLNQCSSFDFENVKDKEISDVVITSTCIEFPQNL